ncbi:MAG: YdcF family protein [Saprospirales bacterium]|nr:YdcF family protein [Saprospirales bacterium]
MFYFFSKLLLFLIQPLNWIFGLLLLRLIVKQPKWKRRCLRISIGLALVVTNPLLSNLALWLWETPAVKIADIPSGYSTALVLGGFLAYSGRKEEDFITFNEFGNRLANALELHGENKVRFILLSGRYGPEPEARDATENEAVKYLNRTGFPMDQLLVEYQSKNTYENIVFSKELLKTVHRSDDRILLLTSAFHMPRAMATARRLGLNCTAFPTDRLRRPLSWNPVDWFFPSSYALHIWELLIKEWVGVVMYKITGYA